MSTTPEQRTLTRGSHWMRVINTANWIYHFGRVHEAADRLGIIAGNLESTVYSRLNRDGWTDTVHASEVWPISGSLFRHVAAAGWDVRNMNKSSDAYLELTMAHSAVLQIEEQKRRSARRDYSWFLSEVEGVAMQAAPTGYKGFNRINDRRILLRFDSAAHAQGAQFGLHQRGFYKIAKVHPSALDVLDRSEA